MALNTNILIRFPFNPLQCPPFLHLVAFITPQNRTIRQKMKGEISPSNSPLKAVLLSLGLGS